MLTIISGNNRNGYPCAINKVGDIFQRGIPPFETEGLTDFKSGNSQDASQKGGFPLAGLRGQMLGSVKVTASEESKTYVGVTVSMTSGESKTYANLSSPESGSEKYRQHRSPMQGLCADNLLNGRAKSAFVQAVGKEKGPRPALRVMQLLTCEEANELHHNSHLQATGNLSYSHNVAPHWVTGFSSPSVRADRISRSKVRFFYVRFLRCAFIMVRRNGGASALAGFSDTGLLTPIRLATLFSSRRRGSKELVREATTMATTQTRPEFIDTYWIIPEYETTPYGKVSFTRQDRRTFIAMFKDSRLVWAGRQPMSAPTKYVKRMRSSKVCLKDPESEKLPVKDPVTLTITNIVTVQGVAHV